MGSKNYQKSLHNIDHWGRYYSHDYLASDSKHALNQMMKEYGKMSANMKGIVTRFVSDFTVDFYQWNRKLISLWKTVTKKVMSIYMPYYKPNKKFMQTSIAKIVDMIKV